jgi:hypothetical protein
VNYFVYLFCAILAKKWAMKKTNFKLEEARQLIKPKISLEEFKKMLNKNGDNFSDDDIKEIRDFLYIIAEIDFIMFREYIKDKEEQYLATQGEANIISISKNKEENNDYLKSA